MDLVFESTELEYQKYYEEYKKKQCTDEMTNIYETCMLEKDKYSDYLSKAFIMSALGVILFFLVTLLLIMVAFCVVQYHYGKKKRYSKLYRKKKENKKENKKKDNEEIELEEKPDNIVKTSEKVLEYTAEDLNNPEVTNVKKPVEPKKPTNVSEYAFGPRGQVQSVRAKLSAADKKEKLGVVGAIQKFLVREFTQISVSSSESDNETDNEKKSTPKKASLKKMQPKNDTIAEVSLDTNKMNKSTYLKL